MYHTPSLDHGGHLVTENTRNVDCQETMSEQEVRVNSSSLPPEALSTGLDGNGSRETSGRSDTLEREHVTNDDEPLSPRSGRLHNGLHGEDWAEISDSFQTNIAQPGRKAFRNFFYPPRKHSFDKHCNAAKDDLPGNVLDLSLTETSTGEPKTERTSLHNNNGFNALPGPVIPTLDSENSTNQNSMPQGLDLPATDDPEVIEQDREYMQKFWTTYDDIIILSLFTQLGILCRLGVASWFRFFDGVFQNNSALFTNLPLNCLSCFVMGLLCSGESLMEIIGTRFTPSRLQHDMHRESSEAVGESTPNTISTAEDDSNLEDGTNTLRSPYSRESIRRRGHSTHNGSAQATTSNIQEDLREIQLLALERRIRASPCLILFAGKKQDIDVVENYFHQGYQRRRNTRDLHDIALSTPERRCGTKTFDCEGEDEESHYVRNIAFAINSDSTPLSRRKDEKSIPPSVQRSNGNQQRSVVQSVENISEEPDEFQDEIIEATTGTKGKFMTSRVVKRNDETSSNAQSTETNDIGLVGETYSRQRLQLRRKQYGKVDETNFVDYGTQDQPDLDQLITNVAADISQKISRIKRVRLADGWDVGTTPEEKSADLILGLRDGLCGALSSFSSWISSMVNLLRRGHVGQSFVGLVLGIQLPIIAYRFGQHVAVYIFVWRCRRETKRDNRRGYGIRLNTDDGDDDCDDDVCNGKNNSGSVHSIQSGDSMSRDRRLKGRRPLTVQEEASETPSVRAIITALFIMALVAQITALNFFYDTQERLVALSLLFSPLGVLARWNLSALNSWRPNFPLGTFACNIGACALSGSLGSILAGNPGPTERLVLVAIIAGFGGTLSSVARFIVEVLAGVDPILFRLDGIYYAVNSVLWGMLVSFLFTASVDWADSVE